MIDPDVLEALNLTALVFLSLIYFFVAVFRSAYAELNQVSASRILASRGLQPREGETPGDLPPVVRMTFDVAHHATLVTMVCLGAWLLTQSGSPQPLLRGGLLVGGAAVFLQILARLLSVSAPEGAFSSSLIIMILIYRVLSPFIAPFAWTVRKTRKMGRARRAAAGEDEATEEEIEAFIDAGQKEGILEEDEGELIRQVVEFHDSLVREVMTPRTDVIALPKGTTMAEARQVFSTRLHSRVPVYREHIDDVIGIITLKNLVANLGTIPDEAPIDELLIAPYFVPESKPVADLLKELQAQRCHMAVVLDEYGGTAGVVTIEDLLEELVGEIQEEHEQEEEPVVSDGKGGFLVAGNAGLDDLGETLGLELEAEGYETISGLVFSVLGRIPEVGETMEYNGLRLEILAVDTRRITSVRVTRLVKSQAP